VSVGPPSTLDPSPRLQDAVQQPGLVEVALAVERGEPPEQVLVMPYYAMTVMFVDLLVIYGLVTGSTE